MSIFSRHVWICGAACIAGCAAADSSSPELGRTSQSVDLIDDLLGSEEMLEDKPNTVGHARTATPDGTINRDNPYFQELGTNGRTCNTCHVADQGWSLTPGKLQALFDETGGTAAVFRPHDAATAPNADVSTESARRAAYKLLLSRGLMRVGLPGGPRAEFVLDSVDDPYGWAGTTQLSLFRRPLPTTNLRFVAAVNWDGRNTPVQTDMRPGLKNQSNGATLLHAQASAPISDGTREQIVDEEVRLVTAQVRHYRAGNTYLHGANGGPEALLTQPFSIGMNDPTSDPAFTNRVFTIFDGWENSKFSVHQEVFRGQRVFNEKTFGATGTATCSRCHSSPNVGGASAFRFFDIGVSAPSRRSPDVPLYTFRRKDPATGALLDETIQTTDPGRALISGKWADMNRFKTPGLRGLAARAPYFHDGSAATITDVVNHYEQRFGIQFVGTEKADLITFLECL